MRETIKKLSAGRSKPILCWRIGVSAVLLSPFRLLAQTDQLPAEGPPTPAFDAVSIRRIEAFTRTSSPGSTGYLFTRHQHCVYTDEKVSCQLSLEELIREAYQRKRYETKGPKWLGEDLFVLQAILPGKTSPDQARMMLRGTLRERFHLKCHLEEKRLPVYELVAAEDGPHLIPADPPEKQKRLPSLVRAEGALMESSPGHFAAVAADLDYIGTYLERAAGLDRPVLNGTHLDGKYRFDLHWDPDEDTDSTESGYRTGIIKALKQQAGLMLRKTDAPVELLVVDSVDRNPSPNP